MPVFSAFLFREFRLLWGAQLGNALGINMDLVARGWLIYDLTGSTLDLGRRFFYRCLRGPPAKGKDHAGWRDPVRTVGRSTGS
jgi:hypothetical protein